MRTIGHLEGESKARAFGDYLFAQGMENQIEEDKEGWAIWIHEEEHLDRAKAELIEYRANPANPKYQQAARVATDLREKKKQDQADYENRLKKRRHLFRPMTAYGFGPVTFLLICASVVVFYLSGYGDKLDAVGSLFITRFDLSNPIGMSIFAAIHERLGHVQEILPEVKHGEVWRLFSPMLIHMSVMHIFFNMWWLRDLGSMVESRQSSWLLVLLVAGFALVSNFAQYLFHGGGFGGMSGVNYALIGYIWIRGKFDPGSGLFLHPSTVIYMIIWFFVCLIGFMGPVANVAHGAGMIAGMAWGYLSSLRYR